MPTHIIFEGAELAGKSWTMSQIYNYLEPKYNRRGYVLDGCHWFNCDNGIFGTDKGQDVIGAYIKIFQALADSNIITEKLHLSDIVNSRLHRQVDLDYSTEEQILARLDFKIVLIAFRENPELIKARIRDRLNLYPHYRSILQTPEWYLQQQSELKEELKKSQLPSIIVETDKLPDQEAIHQIIKWLKV